MSKTHKTNAARKAWHKVKDFIRRQTEPAVRADPEYITSWSDAEKTGRRYGNQRKMRANEKVKGRRAERKRNNRIDD